MQRVLLLGSEVRAEGNVVGVDHEPDRLKREREGNDREGEFASRRRIQFLLQAMEQHHGRTRTKQRRHDGPSSVDGAGNRNLLGGRTRAALPLSHGGPSMATAESHSHQDARRTSSPRDVMAATMKSITIIPSGPYWFLSSTAVPMRPWVRSASPKEPTSGELRCRPARDALMLTDLVGHAWR